MGPVDFRYLGDWTSWSSLLVLLLLFPLTALCLTPFVFVASAVLPGSFGLWMILYFAALPLVLIPGLEFLQVRLVCPESRKPDPEELARLMLLWNRVLAGVGKGKKRRYRLRVADDYRVNAAAGGGSLVIVTTRALTSLPDSQLEAVLAHEFGHHVGFHPTMLLAQQWLARPLDWGDRLSVAMHNLLASLTRWQMHILVFLLVWVAIPCDQARAGCIGCHREDCDPLAAVSRASGRVQSRRSGHEVGLRASPDHCSRRDRESARGCARSRRSTGPNQVVLGHPSPNS